MPARPLPLAEYELFHTRDLDEARVLVANAFAPHELHPGKHETRFDARMNGVAFDRTGLYAIDYGTEARVDTAPWESCFLVALPLSGAVEVSLGREQVLATPEFGSVQSPTERVSLRWLTGAPHLVAWFDRWALEAHLGGMLGREPHRPITFSLGMDLTEPLSRSLLSVVDLLRREVETGGDLLNQPLSLKQLEGLLMTQLLLTQPSNYTSELTKQQPRPAPAAVRQAMELIERARPTPHRDGHRRGRGSGRAGIAGRVPASSGHHAHGPPAGRAPGTRSCRADRLRSRGHDGRRCRPPLGVRPPRPLLPCLSGTFRGESIGDAAPLSVTLPKTARSPADVHVNPVNVHACRLPTICAN